MKELPSPVMLAYDSFFTETDSERMMKGSKEGGARIGREGGGGLVRLKGDFMRLVGRFMICDNHD